MTCPGETCSSTAGAAAGTHRRARTGTSPPTSPTVIPVVYVDPPDSVVWQARRRRRPTLRPGFEQVGDELFRLTPRALPGVTRPWPPGARSCRHQRGVRPPSRAPSSVSGGRSGGRVAGRPVRRRAHTDRRVLYGTDDFVAGAQLMGISRHWVERREPRAARGRNARAGRLGRHRGALAQLRPRRHGAAQRLRHRGLRGTRLGLGSLPGRDRPRAPRGGRRTAVRRGST